MDALLIALGSTGDVLPFCALGRILASRGHSVRVAANPHFLALVERAGLGFVPLGDEDDYRALVSSPDFSSRRRGFRHVMRWAQSLVRPVYELASACRSSTVVAHPLAFGAKVAEARHGLTTATLLLSPALLQSAHCPPVLPGVVNSPSLPGWYKRSVWWAVDRLILDPMIAPRLNQLRAEVGVPRIGRVFREAWDSDHLFLALFPEWFAPRQPDWPRRLVFTGFPLYDDAQAPLAPELQSFLDGGEPPIVFTPGTANAHAREFFAAALESSARLGRRALLLTPFRHQLPPLPPHARHFHYAPLSRLLPRSAALVHHAGIGTAAAALAAGVPQLVTPFSQDQPDNAARLVRLGVAESLPRPRGTTMTAALERLLRSPSVTAACRAAASRISVQQPLVDAAAALETLSLSAVA